MSLKHKVLIIDDDRIVVFLCRSLLEKFGIAGSFSSAANGAIGLDLLRDKLTNDPESLPDLILLDLNMPEMNGWEFLDAYESLRHRFNKRIALMILSSSIDPHDIERAEQHPLVDAYLHKPLDKDALEFITGYLSSVDAA